MLYDEDQGGEQRTDGEQQLGVAVDSGTEVRIIPFKWVTKLMRWVRGPEMVMRGASEGQLRHYGRVEVLLQVKQKPIKLYLEVVDARQALLSVSAMLDVGWRVSFARDESNIRNQ